MGTLVFQATAGGSFNFVGPNIAGTVSLTLPSADGTSGQFLKTDGAGTLSFAAATASAATPTVLGTVYASQTTSGGTPYLTALGYNAGLGITSSTQNTFIGYGAGNQESGTGTVAERAGNNVAVGFQALQQNIQGKGNSAVGHNSLRNNKADYNTSFGSRPNAASILSSTITLSHVTSSPWTAQRRWAK